MKGTRRRKNPALKSQGRDGKVMVVKAVGKQQDSKKGVKPAGESTGVRGEARENNHGSLDGGLGLMQVGSC